MVLSLNYARLKTISVLSLIVCIYRDDITGVSNVQTIDLYMTLLGEKKNANE